MITPSIIAGLESIGITNPAASHWRRIAACTDAVVHFAECICWCGNEPKRVTMVPFAGGEREIHIGQCSVCGEIIWGYWISPTPTRWTGGRTIEAARPMYAAGGGR